MSIPELYTEVLLVAQEEIGRMWLANEITVAEEHFATNTTRSVMAQLLARAPLRPRNGKTVLAAAVAGNRHDIGLLAVADFFEMDGWRVIHLGADVPVSDVVESVRCFHADLLALSASQPPQIQTVRRTLDAVRASRPEQPVKSLIGGRAFLACPNQALELGGDAYAENALEAVRAGDRLLELSFHQGHFSGSPRS